MKISCKRIIFLLVLYMLGLTGSGQDYDEDIPSDDEDIPSDDVNPRFHERDRGCTYRRQRGFCRRRSECTRPTRQICRFGGMNPIVCCLDQLRLRTPTTTTKRPVTTRRSDSVKSIDLTFPGCGLRAPKVQENTRRGSNNRRRGSSPIRGKRSVLENFSYSDATRQKRASAVYPVIVGGVTAAANSWPWMVAMFKETTAGAPERFLCGASLISRRYVLTAAHCFDPEGGNIDPSKFTVVVGAHSTKDGTKYRVQSVLVHPSYQRGQYYNDITLLRIRKDVKLTEKVYPVCLPSNALRNKIKPDNKDVTVTGWGDTSFGGVTSKLLQELTIPIVPRKDCNESYSRLPLTNFPQGITNLFMCAGVKEGGKDSCQGDSGGPLVSNLKDNSWVQLGIVSFGYGCAQPGFPGVYTKVSQFTKWLYDNTDLGNA